MVKLRFTHGTIYNQKIHGSQPPLGKAGTSRMQTIEEDSELHNFVPHKNIDMEKQINDKRDQSLLKINTITKRHYEILFRAKTVFPFDLFPDILTISATKIEIKINSFFRSYSTVTIPLQDIGHVEVNTAMFFATLCVMNIRSEIPVILNYLLCEDAVRGKRIINGLLIAQEAGVDVTLVEPKKLLDQLEKLGG